jgi:hypothetical protein
VHVDAVLVLRVGVFEIVGESERRRKFLSGRWIEVGIGAAAVDCIVPNAEIHDPVRIVGSYSIVSRDVGHEVVNARVPAQIELRAKSPKPVTDSLRPPDFVKPNGPSAPVNIASTDAWLRPYGTNRSMVA